MARQPAEISQQSCFRIDPVPDLHLSGDVRLPLRAYILKCAGDCWYGGLAPAPKIRERIQEQFEADVEKGSSHYCAAHPPESVACVWPVALHAMEAAFFYAMQESLGVTDFRRLGGWVYTSSKPSPLDVMRLTQAHRQLRNTCFDCGQGALCEAQDMPWVQLGLLVQVWDALRGTMFPAGAEVHCKDLPHNQRNNQQRKQHHHRAQSFLQRRRRRMVCQQPLERGPSD